ncbi:MAG: FlgD immunoglobulin-like domain containing protein [Rhodothermales bacterium]
MLVLAALGVGARPVAAQTDLRWTESVCVQSNGGNGSGCPTIDSLYLDPVGPEAGAALTLALRVTNNSDFKDGEDDGVSMRWWVNGVAQPDQRVLLATTKDEAISTPQEHVFRPAFDLGLVDDAAQVEVAFELLDHIFIGGVLRRIDTVTNDGSFNVVPAAPDGLAASPAAGAIELTWDAAAGADTYAIYRTTASTLPGEPAEADLLATTTAPAYRDAAVSAGETYFYRVLSLADGVRVDASTLTIRGAFSGEASAVPGGSGLIAPTLLSADVAGRDVSLAWTASAGATGYNVYRDGALIASTGALGYVDAGLADGTYSYTVTATDAATESAPSNALLATIATPPLPAPVIAAAAAGDGEARIGWGPVADAEAYRVYRENVLVGETPDTVFVDAGLVNGVAYTYEVSAVSGEQESPRSAPAIVTPQAVPPVVAGLTFAPLAPSALDAVRVEAVVSDPDGNLVADSVQVVWWLNDVPQDPVTMRAGAPFVGTIPPQAAGDTVAFTVRAVDAKGHAAAGDTLGYRVGAPPEVLLSARLDTLAAEITLTWSPAGAGPYTLYRTGAPADSTALTADDILQANLSDTVYVDADLTRGAAYFYRVRSATGAFSNEAGVAVPDVPPAPTGLTARAGDSVVDLLWRTAPGADTYSLYRTSPALDTLRVTGLADTAYVDTAVENGTTYRYWVTASNRVGESAPSEPAEATPFRNLPPAVIGLVPDTTLFVDAPPYVIGLDTLFADPEGDPLDFSVAASSDAVEVTLDSLARTVRVAPLRADTARVTLAATDGLHPAVSTSFLVTVLEPGAIALLARVDAIAPSVLLSWTDNGGAPFTLYRTLDARADSALTPADILVTGLAGLVYRDTTVIRNQTYYYRVADRNGAFSNQIGAAIPAVPDVPTGLTAIARDRRVDLTWQPAQWAASYTLFRTRSSASDTLVLPGIVSTAYRDTSVVNDTTYTYWVEAVNALGASGPSDRASATPRIVAPVIVDLVAAPDPPRSTESVEVIATIVDQDANLDAASVRLLWRAVGGESDSTVVMQPLTDSTFAALIPPAAPGDTIRFAVSAGDLLGNTVRSGDRLYRVLNLDDFRLSLSPRSRRLILTWEPPQGLFDSYRVLRTDRADGADWVDLAEGWSDTTFVDEPLENGRVYFYRIAAERGGQEVASSNIAGGQPGIPVTPSFSPAVPNVRSSVLVSGTFNADPADLALMETVLLNWRLNEALQPPLPMVPATAAQLAALGQAGDAVAAAADRSTYVAVLPPQAELDVVTFFLTAADGAGDILAESEQRTYAVNARPRIRTTGFEPMTLVLGDPPLRIALDDIFIDPDGDPLAFASDSLSYAAASVALAGDTLNVFPQRPGIARIAVQAADAFSGSAVDTLEVTVTTLLAPLYVASEPAVAQARSPYTIDAVVVDEASRPVDGRFSIDTVDLYYRNGGETAYRSVAMQPSGEPSAYAYQIPAGEVTERGIEYFISATGRTTRSDFVPPSDVLTQSLRVRVDGLRSRQALPGLTYRIISFPLELDDRAPAAHLVDDFDAYDPKKWRFFEAHQAPGADSTLTEFRAIEALEPGRGYWLISFTGAPEFDMGAGLTEAIHEPFALEVPAGWSLIGNPFAFSLPVGNLALASGRPIRDVRDYTRPVADSLRPYQGYALYVDQADVLLFDPHIGSASVQAAQEDSTAWGIRIVASSGAVNDASTELQVREGATPEWDAHDRPTPPRLGAYVGVDVVQPARPGLPGRYRVDARPPAEEGLVWSIEAYGTTHQPVDLAFEGLDAVPAEFGIRLIDETLGQTIDLRSEPGYTLASASPDAPRRLRIAVGTPAFLATQQPVDLPTTFQLGQNFPNPFQAATTIPFDLPASERVTLEVYNALGARVAVLLAGEERPAGRHSVIWDGRTTSGTPAASGLYIVRIQAGSNAETRATVRVR